MTTEQWFAIITLFLTAAFTVLLLWFAWRAIRIWRAEKRKVKNDEKEQARQSFEDGIVYYEDWAGKNISDYFEEGEADAP